MRKIRFLSLFAAFAVVCGLVGCKSNEDNLSDVALDISDTIYSFVETEVSLLKTEISSASTMKSEKITTEITTEQVPEIEIITIAGREFPIDSKEIYLLGYDEILDENELQKLTLFKNLNWLLINTLNENFVAKDLSALGELSTVTWLSFDGTVDNFNFISGMTSLNELSFEFSNNMKFDSLSENDNAKLVTIYGLSSTDQFMTPLAGIENLTNLEELTIEDCDMVNICGLGKAKSIKQLRFTGSITDLTEVGELSNLEVLTLWYTGINNIESISKCTNLTELILWDVDLDLIDVSFLSNLKKLEFLRIWTISGEFNQLEILLDLPNLKELQLTQLNSEDISILSQLSNLQRLWISECGYSEETKKQLQEALPNCAIDFKN